MNGFYIAKRKGVETDSLGNGVQIKEYLDYGCDIYLKANGEETLVAKPKNTFYQNAYAETPTEDILIATPEDGWIGLNKEAKR